MRAQTERLDGVVLDDLRVPPATVTAALDAVDPDVRSALQQAAEEIAAYHADQAPPTRRHDRDGVVIDEYYVPVARAGCYVPGGRARYPSTVLMTAVPARVAGVDEVVLCAPPGPDGQVPVATLAAAAIAGVDEVYRIGGAQAIGALAYGTESLRPVDVIVGPGNVYVAQAKREVAGLVGVPAAFAGPSEVVVVADDTVPAELCATDIVVQAEHGPGGLAWLITWSEPVADTVDAAIATIVAGAERRADIEATLAEGGYTVLVDGPEQAVAVANAIAPEHLELMTADPAALVPLVRNAGAVFCGPWSPASLGDYVGRAQPRPAHLRLGPLCRRPLGPGLPQADPRGHRRRDRPGPPRPRGRDARHRRGPPGARRVDRGPSDVAAMTTTRVQPRGDLALMNGYHSPQLDVPVRLNTNESPVGPPTAWVDELAAALADVAWNRYPDREAVALRSALG